MESGRDPVREVLWEKKAVDIGAPSGVEDVHVDDLVLIYKSGAHAYVQLKEQAPRSGWTIRHFIEQRVAAQFFRQWSARPEEERPRTILRLAGVGSIAPIRDIVDVALRSRTTRELRSAEGSVTATGDIAALAKALRLRADDPDLLAFLQSIDATHLPDAAGLTGWITRTLVGFGANAVALSDRLVRLVGESKHAGHGARASYTREALVDRLIRDGMPVDDLIGAGVLPPAPLTTVIAWSKHRAAIVRQFERFRLYGLDLPTPVFADLAKLFVPPHVAMSYRDGSERMHPELEMERRMRRRGRRFDPRDEGDFLHDHRHGGAMSLSELFAEARRFGFVAGPGTGKTTTLRWLALVSAMEDDEGRKQRLVAGLPATPLIPVYVSFRQFARRIRARDLEGVPGRVGLVADFLAAQLESGLLGTPPSRERALQAAEWLLKSEETLLLFDGLDEVPDASMRETLFAAVTDLVQNFEQPRVIVATRPSGIRALRLSTQLPFYEPLPLDEPQRAAFARKWYAAVRTDGGTLLDPATTEVRGANLAAAAEALSDLTANPLLLSILALIHFNRGGGVPVDRATLYDHATSAMLGHWDRDAAGRDLGDDAIPRNWSDVLRLTPEQIRAVMEDIGWRLHIARQVEIGVASLAEMLADVIATAAPGGHTPPERASVMLQLLADRSGLLLEREPGVFSFVHLSFRDYLGARFCVRLDQGELRTLAALAYDDAHDELLRFAVGVLRLAPDGSQKTRAFLAQIAPVAPMLAASALLDAPDADLPPATIDALAHGVWIGAERGLSDRQITSQVLRTVLARATNADTLLLALLARSPQPPHYDGPTDLPVRALLARPAGALAPALAWVLTRVARLPLPDPRHHEREWGLHGWHMRSQLRAVAGLLLVESGADVTDHVEALAAFLGDRFPAAGGDPRRTPEERAHRILLAALIDEATRKTVQTRLRSLATAKHAEANQRAVVRLLVEAGVPATTPTVQILTDVLTHTWERDDASALLAKWLAEPASTTAVSRALERALLSDTEAVRRTAGRLLGRVTLPISPANDSADDEREEEERIGRIVALLNDPATADDACATLDEELWDGDAPVAWQAARALAAADRWETPGLAQAFVRVGFASERRQDSAIDVLRRMLADPRSARATRAALLEGSKHATDRVAGVSALLLIETSGASGTADVVRHLQAALRDESTFRRALPHIEALLKGEDAEATIGLLVGYLEGNKPNATIAGEVALLLATHGERAHSAVIRGLVSFGFSVSHLRTQAMSLLRTLLEDRESTTETRRILGKALEADSRDLAWSAARLLCERESFTAAQLPDVLAAKGLAHGDETEREAARGWVAEILSRPRLAKEMREALERAIGQAIHASEYNRNYDLGWEAARCLIAARAYEAGYLAEALITAGFGQRARHAEALAFLRTVAASKAELAADIEEQLWRKLRDSEDDDMRWGTACAVLDLFPDGVREMASLSMLLVDREARHRDGNAEEQAKVARATLGGLLRALLNEEKERSSARQRVDAMLASDLAPAARDALSLLLPRRGDDDDRTTAFLSAEYVLATDGYSMKEIASALIEGGLRDDVLRERAAAALDALRSDAMTEGIVADALGAALWSSDAVVGAAAAAYLVSRGDGRSPGVIRGLVRAVSGPPRRGWSPETHVEARLRDHETRNTTLGALGAVLFHDGEELPYTAARLLLMNGGPVTPRILDVLDGAAHSGNALGPLALLSLTARVADVRAAAGERRKALAAAIGEEA